MISLIIFWSNIGTVCAQEQTLPSGISASELKETINQYVEDNKKTMVVRGIKGISNKLKKLSKEKGNSYINAAFAFAGILTVILYLLSVLGCYKTITIKERKKGYKFVNVLLIINSFSMLVNIFYWNLFKFWAL